jgi:hypothetical protein
MSAVERSDHLALPRLARSLIGFTSRFAASLDARCARPGCARSWASSAPMAKPPGFLEVSPRPPLDSLAATCASPDDTLLSAQTFTQPPLGAKRGRAGGKA